ncbi:uncharacterized protein CEXT_45861 [Caerostris extrusa]|uniref:C2H2-type domain-containing protein n=1 Tax=Caerostris extrusa TaxID=172846 RepID=A0AAV4XHC1_CAEEX|nr:uncharacterized protein CEXT_45861 [Caerostris extrusa]
MLSCFRGVRHGDHLNLKPATLEMPSGSYTIPILELYGSSGILWNLQPKYKAGLNNVLFCRHGCQYSVFEKRFPRLSSNYGITYLKFLRDLPYLSYNMHDTLREKLEHYMNCTITYAGQEKPCNRCPGSFATRRSSSMRLHQKQDDRLGMESMFVFMCHKVRNEEEKPCKRSSSMRLHQKQDDRLSMESMFVFMCRKVRNEEEKPCKRSSSMRLQLKQDDRLDMESMFVSCCKVRNEEEKPCKRSSSMRLHQKQDDRLSMESMFVFMCRKVRNEEEKPCKLRNHENFIGSRRRAALQLNIVIHEHLKQDDRLSFGINVCIMFMEYVMGSFFTKDDMPQYCYTLYSLWGDPDKKRERIPKGQNSLLDTLFRERGGNRSHKFHFNLNATKRSSEITVGGHTAWFPKFPLPTSPSVQIAVHPLTSFPAPTSWAVGTREEGLRAARPHGRDASSAKSLPNQLHRLPESVERTWRKRSR